MLGTTAVFFCRDLFLGFIGPLASWDLDGDGLAGGTGILQFDTLTLTPLANTTVVGRVFASEMRALGGAETSATMDTPLPGVTITVDGKEESIRAVTDRFPCGNGVHCHTRASLRSAQHPFPKNLEIYFYSTIETQIQFIAR